MIYQANDGTMRDGYPHPFGPQMFRDLETFIGDRDVVPLRHIWADRYVEITALGDERPEFVEGEIRETLVGMRHDVDHNLDHALKFARWEHQRGWRSTYFILMGAWYFDGSDHFANSLLELEHLGHEVGIHTNAVALARDAGADPGHQRAAELLTTALAELRDICTEPIVGAAAHGDYRCDKYDVHNNDLWVEQGGEHHLDDFGLTYEAYFLHRPNWYVSDSGGRWEPRGPLKHHAGKQTSMLVHPCHWNIDAELAA